MVDEWPTEQLHSCPDRARSSGISESEDAVWCTLNALKIIVRAERLKYVKSKLEKNCKTLQQQLREIERLSRARDRQATPTDEEILSGKGGSLIIRSQLALLGENSPVSAGKIPQICSQLMWGNFDAKKILFVDISKLVAVGPLPSYTAWIFVDRNERMAKDQSIARRRRISYESNGKETYFCLDAEDTNDDEDCEQTEDSQDFSQSQDFISRMAVVRHGTGRRVLQSVADFLHVSLNTLATRFQSFPREEVPGSANGSRFASIHWVSEDFRRRSICSNVRDMDYLPLVRSVQGDDGGAGVDKVVVPGRPQAASEKPNNVSTTLALALDAFDTLFCRRCLVFNCPLHAARLEEIVAGMNERQPPCVVAEPDQSKPCSSGCRFLSTFSRSSPAGALMAWTSVSEYPWCSPSNLSYATGAWQGKPDIQAEEVSWETRGRSAVLMQELDEDEITLERNMQKSNGSIRLYDGDHLNRQVKRLPSTDDNLAAKKAKNLPAGILNLNDEVSMRLMKDVESSSDSTAHKCGSKEHPATSGEVCTYVRPKKGTKHKKLDRDMSSDQCLSANGVHLEETESTSTEWTRLEMDLCDKGIQIFGKNSCLIARNVLKGCKSCLEIAEYISRMEVASSAVGEAPTPEQVSQETNMSTVELPTRPSSRRKFRFGRKRVAPKSSLGTVRKRIGREVGMLNLCRQYTPCSCESRSGCGKDCPCVLADTHCEKYCGCFKACKNRFRGCQCSKSMCDRRHCPCFAAGRECDPDVCKFCWIECGGHSTSQACLNMRILQRKKKRILLARSGVCSGWGVFTRHSLHKNDYIGEYTGELISHSEADRRGRVYDRETSFLFNLNDNLVVDAFRKGNKLKFANHSARRPNCYAKVLLVRGDHRVGIFAKEKIEAGEELLYDYQYEPEIAPVWAMGRD